MIRVNDYPPDLRRVTWLGAVATGLFAIATWLTTQVASIRDALPLGVDPPDAVVSFGVIAIVVVAGVTAVRAIGQLRRPYDPLIARRIALGWAIATIIVAVVLVSDAVTLLTGQSDLTTIGVRVALGMLVLAGASTVVALISIGRARAALWRPVSADAEPDMLDAVVSIFGSAGGHRGADRFAAWVERSPLSPRRHRVAVGLLGALVAGVGAIAWHTFREGAWISADVAALFGALMAIGVAVSYLLCLGPLRLLRPAGRD
ncbi:MAG: hypothetical protein ABI553_02160 [Chloroflexota bacterium]